MTEAPEQNAIGTKPGYNQPGWVDLAVPDVQQAAAFYSGLFGWQVYTFPDPAAGGYTMLLLDGKQVAAVGPQMNPQQPVAWSVYVLTEDADAAAARAREAGGRVYAEPFDVLNAGRLGVIADPTGAVICLWQPGEHPGAGAWGIPGTVCWVELSSRDLEAAKPFYAHVFGWNAERSPMATPEMDYTVFGLGDPPGFAGAMQMNEQWPADVPSYWQVYFAVADTDATVARAKELGGEVMMGPENIPDVGRIAVLRDNQGAVFGLLGPNS